MLFGFNGWYTGMQNAVIPMCIAVTVNIVHVSTSLWLVFGHGMGITGIAYGSVVAQNTGVLLAVLLLILRYRKILTRFTWREWWTGNRCGNFSSSTATSSSVRSVS